MGAEISSQLNFCVSRQRDGLEGGWSRDMVDLQHGVLAEEDTDKPLTIRQQLTDGQTCSTFSDPAEHVSLQQTVKESKVETASLLATVATHGSRQPLKATNASTNAGAGKEQGRQGLFQVKEACDCDADQEPSDVLENQDLLPHWYFSPESIACKTSFFSIRSEKEEIGPRADRTLSGWYVEQVGVEVAPMLSSNLNPNQCDFPNPGQALCHYHELASFADLEISGPQTAQLRVLSQPFIDGGL